MADQVFKLPKQPKEPPLFRINQFKGLNVSTTSTQIEENQSSDMLNMALDERGALNKRTGYDRIFSSPIGTGKINGMYAYRKPDGTTDFLFAHGTTLYKTDRLPGTKNATTWQEDDLTVTWENEVI